MKCGRSRMGWTRQTDRGLCRKVTAQTNAQGATQLGLERGDARYLDVGP